MALNGVILVVVLLAGAVMLLPRLRKMRTWRAMVTPLASIIGSGFLILGPLLQASYGKFAPLVMAALCLVAWTFGSAIRFTIAERARSTGPRPRAIEGLERTSEVVLAFAYVISVAYYLNLFGAFGTRLIWPDSPDAAKWLTSAIFAIILLVGWFRGFESLERMEYLSVSLKLAIIAGLIVGLGAYFWGKLTTGTLIVLPPAASGWSAVALGFGLLVTVQGFETSRYLGEEYSARERVQSMRWAQIFSTLIYLVYTLMLAYSFAALTLPIKETAIIDLMRLVAPVLPILLVIAALAAQFSAAVADTAGAGGLSDELTHHKLAPRHAYAILVVLGLILTWSANIFEIIAWASRAFAAYYAFQNAVATLEARARGKTRHAAFFGVLTLLAIAIVIFGRPAEGG